MNLAIDIGNSRTKLGVFDRDKLIDIQVWESPDIEKLNAYIKTKAIEHCIFASVNDKTIEADALKNDGIVLELTHETGIPVEIVYKTPDTLGKDRIAAVVGARDKFPGQHCLVIDTGTCITIDMLTDEGKFIGGNIAPGVDMRLLAMHFMTGRLPRVQKGFAGNMLGASTEEAVQNGAVLGVLLEIAGYIEMLKTKFSPLNVVLAGGDAQYLAGMLKSQIFVHPNLVLEGLNKILTFNVYKD